MVYAEKVAVYSFKDRGIRANYKVVWVCPKCRSDGYAFEITVVNAIYNCAECQERLFVEVENV